MGTPNRQPNECRRSLAGILIRAIFLRGPCLGFPLKYLYVNGASAGNDLRMRICCRAEFMCCGACKLAYDTGSKCQIFEISGLLNHSLNGIWDKRPHIVGTWTL